MIVKEEYKIVFRKDVTCQAGSKVLEMTQKMGAEQELPAKLIIGKEQKAGKWPVFLDEESADGSNLCAKIVSITDQEGNDLDDTDISTIADEGNYRIVLKGPQENPMKGTLQLLREEGDANQKSTSETEEALAALTAEKIQEGVVSKEEMDARIKYMRENGVDTFLMTRIIRKYRTYEKPAHKPSCLYVDPFLEESRKAKTEGIIAEGLRAAAGRQAIICEGEKSVGKNVYLETIAWLLNMPMYLVTFSRQMSPSSIYGEKTTDNTAAKALAEFDPDILAKADDLKAKRQFMIDHFSSMPIKGEDGKQKPFAEQQQVIKRMMSQIFSDEEKRIIEAAERFQMLRAQAASVNIVIDASELYDWLSDGGLMCFNEMNMAEANFFASFTNQLLDGTGFLFVPGRGEVKIHPDCVLFGTQNADYQGVEQQNEATMSRFGCLYFRQPDTIKGQLMAAVASALKKDGFPSSALDKKYFTEAENFYKQCRSAVKKSVVSNACLNIRGYVRSLVSVSESNGYAKLKRQIKIHVIDTCPFDERQPLDAILESIVTL